MTDRVRILQVILDKDYRDEEEGVDVIVIAIEMTKGVESVGKDDFNASDQQIASDEYRRRVGVIIAELAMYPDNEFVDDCHGAFQRMKRRRGQR